MLYSEIIAVCSQIDTKHINTLCGQNVELFYVKPDGTYSYHCGLEVNHRDSFDFTCTLWAPITKYAHITVRSI
jgi:hypothetical protein